MAAIILFNKIFSFFLIMIGGFCLVRSKVMRAADSRYLSLLFLNLVMPCGIVNAFQVDYDPQVTKGLLFSVAVAVGIHVIFVILNILLRKPLHLIPAEQTSLIYPACANLTIPLVSATLGQEWVIYTSAFLAVQNFMLWSHCKGIICQERGLDLKKVLTNVNMIAVFLGVIMFGCHWQLPGPVKDAAATLGGMMGPISMLIAGMLVAEADLMSLLKNARLWLITLMRLVAVPLTILVLLKFSGIERLVVNGHQILLITIMGIITPPASCIIQMTQVYTGDDAAAEYASAINVMCSILCIVTMPLIVALW